MRFHTCVLLHLRRSYAMTNYGKKNASRSFLNVYAEIYEAAARPSSASALEAIFARAEEKFGEEYGDEYKKDMKVRVISHMSELTHEWAHKVGRERGLCTRSTVF